MANNDTPSGFRPIGKLGGNPNNGSASEYSLVGTEASGIWQGDPVMQQASNTGYVDIAPAGEDEIIGVAWGIKYDDPTTNKPTFKNYKPASNLAVGTGAANYRALTIFVYDDPYQVYDVQGDAGSAVTDVFKNCDMITSAAGSTTNGCSIMELDSANVATGTASFKIVGISNDPQNSTVGSNNLNYKVIILENGLTSA